MMKFMVVILGAAGLLKGYWGDYNFALLSIATLCALGAIAKSDEVIKHRDEVIEYLRRRLM